MGPGNAVEIFVFQKGKFLGSRCYSQSTVTIGSSRDSALRLRHPDVAGQHAIVRIEGTAIMIADNSAPSGVLVNGKRVSTHTVKSYDEVMVGPFRLKIAMLGGDEEEDPGFGAGASEEVAYRDERDPAEAPTALDVRDKAYDPIATDDEEDAQTQVRRMGRDDRYEAPFNAEDRFRRERLKDGREDRYEATVPRLSERKGAEPYGRGLPDSATEDHRAQRADRYEDPRRGGPLVSGETEESLPPTTGFAGEDEEDLDEQVISRTPMRDETNLPYQDTMEQSAANTGDLPMSAPEPDDGYFDDEDDDEEPFVEPFSLLENVIRERFKTPADVSPFATTEVIRYGDGEILDVLQAAPNRSVKLFPDDFKLVDTLSSGRARLYFHNRFNGTIVRNGKARQLKKLVRAETLVDAKRGIHAVDLREGDYAQILREDAGYLVRFVNPPKVPKEKLTAGFTFNFVMMQIFLGSSAFHFLLLVLMGLTVSETDLVVETESEKFAKVAVKDLKLEKPEKKEEPKPEPKPEVKKQQKVKKVKRIKQKVPRQMTAKQKHRVQKKQVSKVLTALSNLKPAGGGPGRSSLSKLTNIAAVRTPRGSGTGGYKVSGVIGKIAGKGVRLAAGGFGGGKGTKVGSQLLRGGGVGKIAAIAGTGRRVRGRVRKAPTRSIRATGGVLSREAIQRVVSKHMHKIQACYERQLLVSPGLAGKVVFDWVISTSGGVATARQVSSSLRNATVANCILRQIRSWRFPQPQGGSVQVRYPFVFRQQGF